MTDHDYLRELNEQQQQAVTWGDGPLLVVAGAGSGKTRTLAYRVAYLIARGVAPERIMLLTFTRRASREMLSRAATALGDKAAVVSEVWGGTFHATANRLLRIYGKALDLAPEFTIMDQSDAEDMLQVIRHKIIDKKARGRFPRKGTLLAVYSRRMNSGEELDEILRHRYPWCEQWAEELGKIFREYVIVKQQRNVLDYDDLLAYWRYLLSDSGAAAHLQERFDHILVDEYQDTNRLQAEILLGMRRRNRNIMVVGDDAQSIYSFRAATVRNMLDFPSLFPGTHTVLLERNYRSCEPILATTNRVIAQAKERFSKTLFSTREGCDAPQLVTCGDEEHEAETIVGKVLYHYEQGVALHRQAVLFRAGSHSAALELALMKKEIPFHKWGGLKFLEAAHIKDFIAFMRVLENPRDEISWFRVLQLYEGVGSATAAAVYEYLSSQQFNAALIASAPVAPKVQRELAALGALFTDATTGKATELAVLLDRIGRLYLPLLEKNYENAPPRRNDIEHIIELAAPYRSRSRFLAEITLDPPSSTSDFAGPPSRDEDYLILSTIHSAKGCEWDVVYLIHAADGCLPSDMATGSDDEIEEELRLAYVAMTRARDRLYVTWPMRFYSHPQGFSDGHVYGQCSRFFTKDVVATMESVAAPGFEPYDEVEDFDRGADVKGKMRGMWE
ncbi:MAG: ATP-dependent helicase [Chitinispirillaceae bacterium]|nr:ATP-dependent helicase [Chitinispirillaceae bacterium]